MLLAPDSLIKYLFTQPVLNRIKNEIKNDTGQKVTELEVAKALANSCVCEDCIPDDLEQIVKRSLNLSRRRSKKAPVTASEE